MMENQKEFRSALGKRQILIADDEDINREILGYILEEDYEILYAGNGLETLELMRSHRETLSLVLLDLMMPGMNGLELMRVKREEPGIQQIPVIVITADQKAEVDSLNLGAIDFIPKPYPQPDVIQARIRRTIELVEDRQIISYTERDTLTGLYRREYFYRYAEQLDQRSRDRDMDALVLNINHFRMINERFGTPCGDKVLQRVADRLLNLVIDAGGLVCRREADDFMVYCPHGLDYQTVLDEASLGLEGEETGVSRVRMRMGVYENVDKSLDIARRFDRAKTAADSVRGSYSHAIGFYDNTLHEKELFNEQLIEDFQTAVDERQFEVWYQPKFDIRAETPALTGAEALVRWRHPRLGMVSPGLFIPLFEANSLIERLDWYVWREAAGKLRDWKRELGFSVPVSVNVSRIDMLNPGLLTHFTELLAEFGIGPRDFLLEITESAYTQDSDQIIQTVHRLRSLGFQVEMDDFGTGYSSLSMISALPIDALKLDMQFIRSAFDRQRDTRMLEVIIEIADYLSVPVIAEGVETEEQLAALRAMGCDIVQGYYFSKPVPAPEYERFLIARRDMAGQPPLPVPAPGRRGERDDGFSVDFAGLAKALSRDIESIYYVDLEDDSYSEYGSDGDYGLLEIDTSGTNFFDECQRNIQRIVFREDWEKVANALDKAALLEAIRSRNSFSMDYRLLIRDRPLYYRMKVIPAETEKPRHLIIGVSNVDAQITEEQRQTAERQNLESFSRIAQALAQDFFIIYYVDVETDYFIEFAAEGDFLRYGIEKRGEDFFALSRRNMERFVYSEDLPVMRGLFTKENVLRELDANGSFSATYRMVIGDQVKYVAMKVTRLDARHIVIGTRDIDAQVRREQAQARALQRATELASRDALTGVKSKRVFVEAEAEWDDCMESRCGRAFAVAVFDLNGLKIVNDTRGHAAGDDYIRAACRSICETFQHSPVYRIGGDEFAAILTGQDFERRRELEERFRALNTARRFPDEPVVACGMSDYIPGADSRFQDVFERADADMYENKKQLKEADKSKQ